MSTPAQVPDKPIEVTLGDGSVVKGANLEEAFHNLQKMKEDTAAELRRQREEAASIRSQYEGLQAEAERLKSTQRQDNSNDYNNAHYYELLNKDGREATKYALRHVWGVDPDEIRQQFNEIQEKANSLYAASVGAAFTAQHSRDFPGDNESARVLTQRVQDLIAKGIPLNIDTMNYAYSQLVGEGTIKPNSIEVEPEPTPNPSLSGAGRVSSEEAEMQKAEKMSDADLEKFLRSKGMIR